MPKNRKHPTWGGARAGAGKKANPEKPAKVTISPMISPKAKYVYFWLKRIKKVRPETQIERVILEMGEAFGVDMSGWEEEEKNTQ